MPLTYLVNATRRVDTLAVGPITYAEILAHLDREQADGVLALPEFADATRATAAFTPTEVRSLATLLRDLGQASTLGPMAVLVTDDLSFGMLRMLGLLLEGVCDLRPFRDHIQAAVWLSEVTDPGAARRPH